VSHEDDQQDWPQNGEANPYRPTEKPLVEPVEAPRTAIGCGTFIPMFLFGLIGGSIWFGFMVGTVMLAGGKGGPRTPPESIIPLGIAGFSVLFAVSLFIGATARRSGRFALYGAASGMFYWSWLSPFDIGPVRLLQYHMGMLAVVSLTLIAIGLYLGDLLARRWRRSKA
jgi:hypothetical protein